MPMPLSLSLVRPAQHTFNPLYHAPEPCLPTTPESSRAYAFGPGGPLAQRFFAKQNVAMQIGSLVFCHGGLLPPHSHYGLDKMNREMNEWIEGK